MSKHNKGKRYVPCTPAGTPLAHLASDSKQKAIDALLKDAAHMPYGDWAGFRDRGYTIEVWRE